MKQVWVFAEHQAGQWTSVTGELLVAARNIADQLNGELNVIVCGDQVEELAATLKQWKVDRVYLSQHPELNFYHPLVYTETIVDLVSEYGCPEMILFGATYLGRDLAPAIAARLGTGCAADCCDLKLDENGNLLQIVPGLGGTIFATIVTPFHRPQVATVKPGMLETLGSSENEDKAKALKPVEVVKVEPRFPQNTAAIQLHSVKQKPAKESGLQAAKRIVAGGAGISGPEGWSLLEELADVLGAAVGATRPAVDEGWASHDLMIGQSGKTVRPELYLGIGISGDMMHTIGIKGKGTLIAINQDPKAAIFKQVDYGIVADYRSILPVLIEEVKRREG
ncbi:MAG: electron transfer flavoprotein subunit alpha/FixB family protein [Syntrophomonadaceae bacterium]|nr:electron transfer flavoprotein subunit alpha/FixB family protein [Syntrophomonadaceae bacterium]